nr:hypothetical protein [Tanacetum cinerariifolium]
MRQEYDFKNKTLAKFFDEVVITQQFSAARTPQQYGVVERRNGTLVEATRTMLTFANLPSFLWAEAIATACFTQNHSIIHKRFDKTPYELINKRKPNIKFFRVFGCRCYLLNDYEDVGNLKAKGDIGVFIGYSKESAAFKIYNKRTRKIHERVNVNLYVISEMASKQFSLEPDLSKLNETGKCSNPLVSKVSEASKKDLEDLFQDFFDEYFDSLKIMKSSTTNVETSINEEVFHEAWYDILSQFSIENGFQKGSIDTTLFIKKKGKHIMLIQIYVDDIIFGSTNPKYYTKFSDLMVKRFEMSMMGEMKFFLGLQVNQFSNGIFINQSKYILDILKIFGMENCDTVPTPMVEQAKLKLDLVGKPIDHTDYSSHSHVTSSRPDIMFATCMCARYQANPNEHHVSAVRRIFRYLKGTINLGLWYPKDFVFDLTTYSDADHAGCHLDRKTESEYVADSSCCAQVLWMRTQLTDYGFFYDKLPIYCDSKSAIAISCNPVQHTQTKHIDVRTGIDQTWSLSSHLGKLGLGDGV